MSCFSCCEEDDSHRPPQNGAFMANSAATSTGHYQVKQAAPRDTQVIAMQPIAVPPISMDDLKDATDNFGTKSLIGEGSYGRVYYGVLKNGQAAAIKKLDSSKQPEQEFLAQVSVVSRLKDENVVGLLGYCVEGPLRVLAYEYAPNGSLHDILHGKKGVKGARLGPVLSWAQRVKIAVCASRGLEYLHEKAQPHIIHRDIKSSNVLLFDDYVAKIADFVTAKRDDTPLHSAVREGNLGLVLEIMGEIEGTELKGLLAKQNQFGETALYVAAECGYGDLVKEMMKYYDASLAGIKARNGYDAFHIAAKQGDLKLLKIFIEADLELSVTFDSTNTTALHTAASQGHVEVVNFLLDKVSSLAAIARSNGKTALHSAARNGHLEIVKALTSKELGIATRVDKKGQTALHMAVKGQNVAVVDELMNSDDSLINMVDAKGNTALHIATRKGRVQIAQKLLEHSGLNPIVINKSGETALDTAEKAGQSLVAVILQEHGVKCANFIKPQTKDTARELKQTVSDIKHEVHYQLEHTRQTRKHVRGIAKRLSKIHVEGLNNAISSTTVVAVLIATIAFAAIFSVPGQYFDSPKNLAPGFVLGEARIAQRPEFLVFIIFDAFALFISLAVVVVQTSVVVIERKAKKQMMAVINKLMWLACVMISVAFLALSYIVVGDRERWLAVSITVVGAVIMLSTLGTMCYWVIINRIEVGRLRSIRRSSMSRSCSPISVSESEILTNKLYAV